MTLLEMLDFRDKTFSSVHMLSHTRREAGTWPKTFVLQHVGLCEINLEAVSQPSLLRGKEGPWLIF